MSLELFSHVHRISEWANWRDSGLGSCYLQEMELLSVNRLKQGSYSHFLHLSHPMGSSWNWRSSTKVKVPALHVAVVVTVAGQSTSHKVP